MTTSTRTPPTKRSLPADEAAAKQTTPERKAAARALYEGQPGASCQTVATETGIPLSTIKRWRAEGNWQTINKRLPDMTHRAAILADSFTKRLDDENKAMSDTPAQDEITADKIGRELAEDFAVDVRAQVLDRHRKEWAAPRKIAYSALQKGSQGNVAEAFEMAKLAKISSETLSLIQTGECRAYGISPESRSADDRTVVVVQRGPATDPLGGISPSPETSTTGGEF